MSIAHLGMYDLEEVRSATDALWEGLARAFRLEGIEDVPELLERNMSFGDVWRAPDLLFSQTCGYPLMTELRNRVSLVATPLYDTPETAAADYCSLVLVRDDDPAEEAGDLRGRIAAVNSSNSQSGYSALRAVFAPLARDGGFFADVRTSGGHAKSVAMVGLGEADVCACDSVTYHLLARVRPAAVAGLRVLCQSPAAPNLPYVTRGDADGDLLARLRGGLARAMADPDLLSARQDLLLSGVKVLPLAAYDRILAIENAAVEKGYPRVA